MFSTRPFCAHRKSVDGKLTTSSNFYEVCLEQIWNVRAHYNSELNVSECSFNVLVATCATPSNYFKIIVILTSRYKPTKMMMQVQSLT